VWHPMTSPSSLIVAQPEQSGDLSVTKYGISNPLLQLQ